MKVEALVETLALKREESEAKIIRDKLVNIETEALVDTVAGTQAYANSLV